MAFGTVLSTFFFHADSVIEPKILRVSEYLTLVNETLRMIPSQDFVVEGEVSDFRVAQQKWISFDLKDEDGEAVLKCFLTAWQLSVPVENGMRVRISGYSKIYERFGQFRLNVQTIEPVGEGAIARAYQLLKKKLEDEGLFDVSRKRPLPRFIESVGLITSRDAAAYGDFLRVLNNRWGGVTIEHAHVHVQGREAVEEILGAFAYFNRLSPEDRPDVLVLTRGGGGLEDLHAFNDEQVARAIFQSKIPVVVGVGHERDESLADFVADVRASTPSNAAERIVPSRNEIERDIENMRRFMEDRFRMGMDGYHHRIDRTMSLFGTILNREKVRLQTVQDRFDRSFSAWLPSLKEQLNSYHTFLRQVDPKRVLARGYSIVTRDGEVVKDASVLEPGNAISVQLAQGRFDAEVVRHNAGGQQRLV